MPALEATPRTRLVVLATILSPVTLAIAVVRGAEATAAAKPA